MTHKTSGFTLTETLVAMSSITGDAADDAKFAE